MPVPKLDKTFAALADPTRRAILARLRKGEATVNELTKPFKMSQPAISRHLKVLEDAGLIESSKKAQSRPRTLRAAPMRQAFEWLEDYHRMWEGRSAGLDRALGRLRKQQNSLDAPEAGRSER